MSVAYYIVPEREVPGLDCFVNGKALAHVRDSVIERACRGASVRPLLDFLSSDPQDDAEFYAEEGIDPPLGGFPDEEWFAADDGLRTIRGLLSRVGDLAAAAESGYADHVADDLRQYEAVLVGLERAGVRWHLAVDA